MPKIRGILETAVYVKDPSQAARFYQRLFGFDVLLESERLVALGVAGRDVLLLFPQGATRDSVATPGGVIPGHGDGGPGHFAFLIAADEMPAWEQKLAEERVPVESTVTWEGGARSLYFRDLDENLVELMTAGFWYRDENAT